MTFLKLSEIIHEGQSCLPTFGHLFMQRQLKLDGPRTEGEILDFWNYHRYHKSLITSSKHL